MANIHFLSRNNYRDGIITMQLLEAKAVRGNYEKKRQKCTGK